ncbi:peptidyl-prolyl cis-trans isomerase [Gluconacetobacter azotocaptans]|uniref:peptidylprolyl isomerase n=1 Tax=Gluconacetobacter azotocaptans TaxID=142834 RepID=UPI001956C30D|nr:peptidylprolyl isomerase [Gluconacetobacter azotocaptans]MBM9403400.1 peptidyl-prolyl cis-trans isomerase [Gluconacetobacter azotocaptans]
MMPPRDDARDMGGPAWRDAVPFLAFLVIGGCCFLLYWVLEGRRETIDIPRSVQWTLFDDYATLSGHEPDEKERRTVLDGYVADEILFRESLRRRLYLADGNIRQRMIDQVRFMVGGSPPDPTEAQMRAYYAAHPNLYRGEPEISFRHVFFRTAPQDPVSILMALRQGQEVKGDDFWMGHDLPAYGQSMISSMFGLDFLHALQAAPAGTWTGPIRSSRGFHFVRVEARTPATQAPYDKVRDAIRADMISEERDAAIAAEVARLRRDFDVAVER